jgi:transcriptional regulator with XRE-family HTH domain
MPAKPAPDNPFDALRRAREASGESVDDLAARAGVDPGWLAGVEKGAAPDDDEKLGLVGNALSIDLSKIFAPRRRRPASRTRAASSSSMDAAVRKAVKAEVEPLAKKVRALSDEVVALEKALREVAKVAAAAAKASKAPAKPSRPAAKKPATKKPAAKARR